MATRKLLGYGLVLAGVFALGYLVGFVAEQFEEPSEPLIPPPSVSHVEQNIPGHDNPVEHEN